MMHLARILRSRQIRSAVVISLAGLFFVGVALDTARACWNTVLLECMDNTPPSWPWSKPVGAGRTWRVCSVVGNTTYCNNAIPAQVPRWYPHTGDYYDVLMCPDDDQSLWCYGYPIGNDPEFDDYSSNLNTYVTYGRLNLSTAISARVVWSMWSATEMFHDSIYWGASKTNTLVDSGMKIGGSLWLETDDWERYEMDLDSLHDFLTGAPFSFIGEDTVYVFWRFRSDGNTTHNTGTFIDNITVAWDDGLQDLHANHFGLVDPDGMGYSGDPQFGDTIIAEFGWSICDGAVELYEPYHVIVTVNNTLVFDTLMEGTGAGEAFFIATPPWVVTESGDFVVRLSVDSLNQITENNETNNTSVINYHVDPPNYPPTFVWVTPGTDTLVADTVAVLRWTVTDPEEQASVSIYNDNEPEGCVGSLLPGGLNRPELDGPDSLLWDVRSIPNHRLYYIYARVSDAANDTCIYAAFPLLIEHIDAVGDPVPGAIPDAYYLAQNYPNPFNPATEIRYGLATPGLVTLKVFDLLGREVTSLVNDRHEAGNYTVSFNGASLPSGLYMYVLTSPEGTVGRKMMLMK